MSNEEREKAAQHEILYLNKEDKLVNRFIRLLIFPLISTALHASIDPKLFPLLTWSLTNKAKKLAHGTRPHFCPLRRLVEHLLFRKTRSRLRSTYLPNSYQDALCRADIDSLYRP